MRRCLTRNGRKTVIVVGLCLSFVVGACNSSTDQSVATTNTLDAASALAGSSDRGETVFQATCATCHGRDAKGLPGLGVDLVASEFTRSLSDAELIDFIIEGRPASHPANTTGVEMPPRGGNDALGRQELADVVDYLRSVQE